MTKTLVRFEDKQKQIIYIRSEKSYTFQPVFPLFPVVLRSLSHTKDSKRPLHLCQNESYVYEKKKSSIWT